MIVQALRSVGWMVVDLSQLGGGVPDLLVARGGVLRLVEVKDGVQRPSARKLTSAEALFHQQMQPCGVQVRIIERVDQAVQLS
mgnify:FL=1